MPVRTNSSATWSRLALSDSPALQSGKNSCSLPSHTGLDSECSREATQFRFPWMVLISPAHQPNNQASRRVQQAFKGGWAFSHPPLCPSTLMGWASGHLGFVLVEYRLW